MKTTILLACLLFFTHLIYSQENIAASGGNATGSGGSSSYSVGQLVYTTSIGSGGTISQGVQQSFELTTLSNPELTTVNLRAVTYPNPTTDYVLLNISDPSLNNLSYNLYNVAGKLISHGIIISYETKIKMQHLDSAIYFLKVNQNSTELKTFKIIKK